MNCIFFYISFSNDITVNEGQAYNHIHTHTYIHTIVLIHTWHLLTLAVEQKFTWCQCHSTYTNHIHSYMLVRERVKLSGAF